MFLRLLEIFSFMTARLDKFFLSDNATIEQCSNNIAENFFCTRCRGWWWWWYWLCTFSPRIFYSPFEKMMRISVSRSSDVVYILFIENSRVWLCVCVSLCVKPNIIDIIVRKKAGIPTGWLWRREGHLFLPSGRLYVKFFEKIYAHSLRKNQYANLVFSSL